MSDERFAIDKEMDVKSITQVKATASTPSDLIDKLNAHAAFTYPKGIFSWPADLPGYFGR